MQRNEVNLRAVLRPKNIAFVETTERQLLRLHFFIRIARRLDHPDVRRMLWIGVAFVVFAIDRARDYAHVTFVL